MRRAIEQVRPYQLHLGRRRWSPSYPWELSGCRRCHARHNTLLRRKNFRQSTGYTQNVTVLQPKTILFVGCGGVNDPNFDALMRWVKRHDPYITLDLPHRHCLLIRDDERLRYRPLLGVKYGEGYEDLTAFLKRLLDD